MMPAPSIVNTFSLPTATDIQIEYRWMKDRRVYVWQMHYERVSDYLQSHGITRVCSGQLLDVLEIGFYEDADSLADEISKTILAHFDSTFGSLFIKKGSE